MYLVTAFFVGIFGLLINRRDNVNGPDFMDGQSPFGPDSQLPIGQLDFYLI